MIQQVIYEPGTGTIIGLDNVVVIELPKGCTDLEDMEAYCAQNLTVKKCTIEVDYAPLPDGS